jgi:hypothetical protein
LKIFFYNEDLPWYFDNRNRLYLKDGPDDIGNIGVWHWTATPRKTDYTKDFINTEYISDIALTEIVELKSIDSVDDLINTIKYDGIRSTDSGIETIYCVKTGRNEYKGILCKDEYFNISTEKKTIKPELSSLPLIELNRDEIIQTEGHAFLRSLVPPVAKRNILIKSPMEIVKDIVIKRCSWSTMKAAGFTRNESKDLRDYIRELPDEDLLQEVSNSCCCSIEEAKSFVDKFVNDISKYLGLDDIEFQIVEKAVVSHEALSSRYRDLVKQQWEIENASKIAKEKEKLDAISKQIEERKKDLTEINSEIKLREADREKLFQEIDDNQHFADEVQTNVEKKIREAKENAAAFIAEMAFSQPVISKDASMNEAGYSSTSSYKFIEGMSLENDGIEKVSNLIDCAGILIDELQDAGVSEEYCTFLAAFLISAWSTRMPLLFAGPNTSAIADALSVSLDCKMADHIQCAGNYSPIVVNRNEERHGVTVIENVFSGDWIDHIQNLTPDKKRYYIFTNPFAEDLMIEPRGLYNYMLPFFTEPFINDVPTCNFYGGILDEKYAVPQSRSNASIKGYEQLLKRIGCNNYLLSRISKIVSALSAYPGYKPDWDYYVLLAYSSLTGVKDALLEQMDHDSRVSSDCKNLIKQY